MDSGATHHAASNLSSLTSTTEYTGYGSLTVGDASSIPISHVGHASISVTRSLQLRNILWVPNIQKNLISISIFTADNNVIIEFDALRCLVKDKTTKAILVRGRLRSGLYQIDTPAPASPALASPTLNNACTHHTAFQASLFSFCNKH